MKHLSSLLLVLIWSLTAACATVGNKASVTNDDVTIKNVNSPSASINLVNVESSGTSSTLRGKIRRQSSGRGAVPGHLDITITKPDGSVQYDGQLGYMRNNRNSAYSTFSLALDSGIAKGSTIQIKHHETGNIREGGH